MRYFNEAERHSLRQVLGEKESERMIHEKTEKLEMDKGRLKIDFFFNPIFRIKVIQSTKTW